MKNALHAFFWNGDDSALPTVFGYLNTSGSGSLTAGELEAALSCLFSDYVSKEEILQMIVDADADKSGTIEPAEFIEVMKKQKESGASSGWNRLKLFDTIGGSDGVQAIVDKMYAKVIANESIAPYFVGKNVSTIIANQVKYFAAAVGGPNPWTGRTLE